MSDHAARVAAIVQAHAHLALPMSEAAAPIFTSEAQVYQAAKAACIALGFIDKDAECVANAWQAMAERKGSFDATQWPAEPQDFCLHTAPHERAFAPCPMHLGLYAVLPDAAWVGRMARAGVPTVQLRFKSDNPQHIEQEVQAAVEAVQGTSALLFINDHWQAAMRAGAYGVHLGQEDMEVADLQAIQQAGLRLGLSSHGYAEMLRAAAFGPSYIALGAVFPTTLKRMATAPQGLGRLAAYVRLMCAYPLVAIGGIDESNLPQVLATGVGSVAMVRALTAADNPELTAAQMQSIMLSAV